MLLQNKKIAIIGGGPGGLTLAALLQKKGVVVTVYERDMNSNVRIQGGALDLHTESGLAALEKAGLLQEFKDNFRPGAEKVRVVDNQAKIHSDEHTKNTTATFGDKHHRPEIDRGPLRNILLNALQPDTVVWDSHIASLVPVGNSWKIIFQNGSAAVADVVIGADGANSKIRPFVTPVKPLWAGVTLIEGVMYDSEKTAPRIHALLKGGKIFAYGNEKIIFVSSKGDGDFGFGISLKTHEHWVGDGEVDFTDNKQVLAWFKKEFKEWNSVWHELFASEKTRFIPRPQYCMPLDQKWEAKTNITLIGDAAHWMPPFAGEGVNMAMLDALQLSEALTNSKDPDIRTAIASYEKKMFRRFAIAGQGTMFNTKWMHGTYALRNMLSMFGSNVLKSGFFIAKMMLAVFVFPFSKRLLGLSPNNFN